MKPFRHVVAVALALIAAAPTPSLYAHDWTSPAGLWRAFDDKTGRPSGLLRIFEREGRFFARIEQSLGPGDATRLCTACTDERRNQPLIGLVIMRNMRLVDGRYDQGDILDPRSGSTYRCRFQLEQGGSRLTVRGFLGISLLGRSQTWERAD